MKRSAKPPLVIHIFSPFRTKLPSGCRVALRLGAERVGAGARFAEAVRADDLAGDAASADTSAFCASRAEERERQHREVGLARRTSAPNDADVDMLLRDDQRRDLVEATPPYSSGTSMPSSPSSPQRLQQLARERPVVLLEPVERRHDFLLDELRRRSARSAGARR